MKKNLGFSLIEMVVVLGLFAMIAIVSAQSLLFTLKGARKSESLNKNRENIDYAVSVTQRLLRNASEIITCPLTDNSRVDYKDQDKIATYFSCANIGSPDGYLASGSARLTSDAINVTTCSFACTPSTGGSPPYVDLTISSGEVSTTSRIYVRSY